jgi:large-conductance mechanosensitive channel
MGVQHGRVDDQGFTMISAIGAGGMEALEIGKFIDAGLAFTLAGLAIFFYRQDTKERLKNAEKRTEEAMKRAEQERQDKLLMIEIIRGNTLALTRLEVVIGLQERREQKREDAE